MPEARGQKPVRRAWLIRIAGVSLVAGSLLALAGLVAAGDCVDAMDGPAIIRRLSSEDPDNLTADGQYLVWCLDNRVYALSH